MANTQVTAGFLTNDNSGTIVQLIAFDRKPPRHIHVLIDLFDQ